MQRNVSLTEEIMSRAQGADDEVVIGRPAEAIASFRAPETASKGSADIPLRLAAGELSVLTTVELGAWSGGPARLIAFFDDLEASWRGWPYSKEWNVDEGNVAMSARHDGIGLVTLAFSVSRYAGWAGPGSFELRVVVPVEPGSLQSIAEKIRSLLRAAG
jgi:hypothetical protein